MRLRALESDSREEEFVDALLSTLEKDEGIPGGGDQEGLNRKTAPSFSKPILRRKA